MAGLSLSAARPVREDVDVEETLPTDAERRALAVPRVKRNIVSFVFGELTEIHAVESEPCALEIDAEGSETHAPLSCCGGWKSLGCPMELLTQPQHSKDFIDQLEKGNQ